MKESSRSMECRAGGFVAGWTAALAVLALAVAPCSAQVTDPPDSRATLPLARLVPSDTWFFWHYQNTPSRAFVNEHWTGVAEALTHSGIGGELKQILFSNLPADKRASIEPQWLEMEKTFSQIDWRALFGAEWVVAERWRTVAPEVMVIARPRAESRAANIAALAGILRQLAASDDRYIYSETPIDDMTLHAFRVSQTPVGLFLLDADPVVAFSTGEEGMDRITALVRHPQLAHSLAGAPRYQVALEKVPAAEFQTMFADLQLLFRGLRRIPAAMQTSKFGGPADPASADMQSLFQVAIRHADVFDYLVATFHMEGLQECSEQITCLRPDAMNTPLAQAITQRAPLAGMERCVPASATGYALLPLIDINRLYDWAHTIVRDGHPGGETLLTEWAALQDSWGFHVKADLLDWISGETVIVEFPPPKNMFQSDGESVVLVRIKDRALANQKIRVAVDWARAFFEETGQPMTLEPCSGLPQPDFTCMDHPMLTMLQVNPTIGTWRDWLVIGSSQRVVGLVMETYEKNGPTFLDSPRFLEEGLRPDASMTSASFTDLRGVGQELTAAFFAAGFVAGTLPDRPDTKPARMLINTISRLGPVVAKITFYRSSSHVTRYENGVWRTNTVLSYKPLPESAPARAN